VAGFSMSFNVKHVLASPLVVTFPAGFEVLTAPTGGSPCLSNFARSADHLQITADKFNCPVGPIILSGATVRNPPTAGNYEITWVNDDPGGTIVPIIDSDQFLVSARVDSALTFDVGAQAAASACSGSFAGDGGTVALGVLTPGAVTSSDALGVAHVCTRLTTNNALGATVAVRSLHAALQSLSTPDDAISSASATLVAGIPGYGLCVGSASADSGWDSVVPGTHGPVRSPAYAGECSASDHQVGALATSNQSIWTVAGPTQNAFARLYVKAAISPTTRPTPTTPTR